jgi:hypothetical protein
MQNSAAVGYHRGPPARCSIPQHLIERDWEAVVPLRQVSTKIVILHSDVNSNRLKIHQVSSVRLQVNHRLLRRQWTQLLRSWHGDSLLTSRLGDEVKSLKKTQLLYLSADEILRAAYLVIGAMLQAWETLAPSVGKQTHRASLVPEPIQLQMNPCGGVGPKILSNCLRQVAAFKDNLQSQRRSKCTTCEERPTHGSKGRSARSRHHPTGDKKPTGRSD